jgi:hypothetical protein
MKNYLIIYHHKTGCVLARNLIKLYKIILKNKLDFLKNNFNNNLKIKYENDHVNIKYNDKYILNSNYNFYFEPSPLYSFNIFNVFKKVNKFVHFIRDPFDQSISNFVYHTKNPTPEEWFMYISNNINSWFNKKKLYFYFDLLNLDRSIIDDAKLYLKNNYKLDNKKSYYQNLLDLKKESLKKAIILETFRFIFCSSHILKMAIIIKNNYKYKYKKRILNLSVNDFKDDKIENTVQKISSYFFDEKINNKVIVNKLKKSYDNTKKKGIHVNNKSNEYKNKLKNKLKNNIIINKIFTKIQDIIAEYS